MATSIRSASSSHSSQSIASSLLLEDGLHIPEGGKFSRKNFKATVSAAKKNTFAFVELNEVFNHHIKKGEAVVVHPNDSIPFSAQAAKDIMKFANTGKIIINNDGKSFRLPNDFLIDPNVLKMYKEYISRGFEVIEAAAKVGSKRSTVNNAGAVLTNEGYTFLMEAYVNGVVTDEDVATYGTLAGVREDRINEFVNVYHNFVLSLTLSLTPSYGNDEVNSVMQGILNNTLSSKLLHFYKSLRYRSSETGKYTPDNLMLSLNTAYGLAISNSDAKRTEYANKVGESNYARFEALLEQYLKPVFSEAELYDISVQRNKTAKEERRKQYLKAKRLNTLAELRRYDSTLTDKTAQSTAKKLSNLTTATTFTSQTFMTLSHAILDPTNTNTLLKSSKHTSEEKERKVLLKRYLHDYEVNFIDHTQTNPAQIRDAAYNLIVSGQYAIAAKFVNAYINASMNFIKEFIVKNNVKVPTRKGHKTDDRSIVSLMNA